MSKEFLKNLETKYGGCVSIAQAALLLQLSERQLMQAMVAGAVIAADCDNRYMFPVFQFKGGQILPGLTSLLSHTKGATPEEIMEFLWNPLGELTPIDMLLAGPTEVEMFEMTNAAMGWFL
jgi:hypothetical protein